MVYFSQNGSLVIESKDSFNEFLNILETIKQDFRKEITLIRTWWGSRLCETDLEAILFEILPCFQKVRRIELSINEIESLQNIALRIRGSSGLVPINELEQIKLDDVGCIQKIKDGDKIEKKAMLTLLDAFDGITSIGEDPWALGDAIVHRLKLNQAGRRYLTRSNESINSLQLSSTYHPITVSLWPTVLERAYHTSSRVDGRKCATGLFHLLRNGSVLSEVIVRWQSLEPKHCQNVVSDDKIRSPPDSRSAVTEKDIDRSRKNAVLPFVRTTARKQSPPKALCTLWTRWTIIFLWSTVFHLLIEPTTFSFTRGN